MAVVGQNGSNEFQSMFLHKIIPELLSKPISSEALTTLEIMVNKLIVGTNCTSFVCRHLGFPPRLFHYHRKTETLTWKNMLPVSFSFNCFANNATLIFYPCVESLET